MESLSASRLSAPVPISVNEFFRTGLMSCRQIAPPSRMRNRDNRSRSRQVGPVEWPPDSQWSCPILVVFFFFFLFFLLSAPGGRSGIRQTSRTAPRALPPASCRRRCTLSRKPSAAQPVAGEQTAEPLTFGKSSNLALGPQFARERKRALPIGFCGWFGASHRHLPCRRDNCRITSLTGSRHRDPSRRSLVQSFAHAVFQTLMSIPSRISTRRASANNLNLAA